MLPSAAGSICSTLISITGVTSEPSTGSFSINISTGSCGVVNFYLKAFISTSDKFLVF